MSKARSRYILFGVAAALSVALAAAEPLSRAQIAHRLEAGERDLRNLEAPAGDLSGRSEEHTSELQSRLHLVCRLLLEKKKKCPSLLHASLDILYVHTSD